MGEENLRNYVRVTIEKSQPLLCLTQVGTVLLMWSISRDIEFGKLGQFDDGYVRGRSLRSEELAELFPRVHLNSLVVDDEGICALRLGLNEEECLDFLSKGSSHSEPSLH